MHWVGLVPAVVPAVIRVSSVRPERWSAATKAPVCVMCGASNKPADELLNESLGG